MNHSLLPHYVRRSIYTTLNFFMLFVFIVPSLYADTLYANTLAQTAPLQEFIWFADHETGDFCQWQYRQGQAIYNTDDRPNDNLTPITEISQDIPARRGGGTNHSIKLGLPGAKNGNKLGTRVFRRYIDDSQEAPLPGEAYYSAWYYFPKVYKPEDWWNIFQFKTKGTSAKGVTSEPMFSFNIEANENEQMLLYVNHKRKIVSSEFPNGSSVQYRQQTPLPIQAREWVHIESYLRKSSVEGNGEIQPDGQLTIWQNGTKILDQDNIKTLQQPDARLHWSVNNYTDNITNISGNEPVTLYIDDAAISRRRLGPEATLPQQPAIPQATGAAPDGITASADPGSIDQPLALVNNRVINQKADQGDDGPAGRAVFPFNIEKSGDYYISGLVYAQDGHSDAFLIDVDNEPTAADRWSFGKSTSFEYRRVALEDRDEPRIFQLSAGQHQIVLRGSESCAQVAKFIIYPVDGGEQPGDRPPAPTPTPTPTSPPTSMPAPTATPLPPSDQPPGNPPAGQPTAQPTAPPATPPSDSPPANPPTVPPAATPVPSNGATLSLTTPLELEVEEGDVHPPFRMEQGADGNTFVYQELNTRRKPDEAGQIVIQFAVAEAGVYRMQARVAAADSSSDSFLISVDSQPHPEQNRWGFGATDSAFRMKKVRWPNGNTTFNLTPGEHLIIIRGREANAQIDRIVLEAIASQPQPEPQPQMRIALPMVQR